MLKLTPAHLTMNNIFPPINGHSRPPSEDLRAVGSSEIPTSTSKTNQPIRRSSQQNLMEQQRRTPLRSSSLLPSSGARYVTAAAAAAAAVASPNPTGSPLLRSPSFVQTAASSTQFEPAKIIYRSSDFAWTDHPSSNPAAAGSSSLRAPSPLKNKLSSSARHLVSETIHENPLTNANGSSLNGPSPLGNASNLRDEMNNVDFLLTNNGKARGTGRIHRTTSNLDKSSGTTGHALPMRSESYRSSRLDYGLRSRHTSSKQRHYISSKTSFYDINAGEFYVNGGQDENLYYHQQSPMNMINSSQRLNGSSFELNTSRKPFTVSKSNTFNMPSNPQIYHSSSQDLHRHETSVERNHSTTRVTGRAFLAKEQIGSSTKYRHTSSTMPVSHSTTPADRHDDGRSTKSRDPNDSYAYNNVKKYIEENELMTPEKEQLIRNWVLDVEKYRHQLQKVD